MASHKRNPGGSHSIQKGLLVLTVAIFGTGWPLDVSEAGPRNCRAIFAASDRSGLEPSQNKRVQSVIEKFRNGAKSYDMASAFAHEILKKSAKQQEAWLAAIGTAYRQIPKKNPNPMAGWHIGGRRVLDRVLTIVERHDQRFQEWIIEAGLSPKQAYERFMERQNALFGSRYSSSEVTAIIHAIQAELPRLRAELHGYPLTVTLGGSFINGKASLRDSDIDVSVNNPNPTVRYTVQNWKNDINRVLRQRDPDASLNIELHIEPAAFYGALNPVVIEIRPDSVRLLVFPPGRYSSYDRRIVSTQPAVYEL